MANNEFYTSKFQNGTAASPGVTFQDVTTGFFRSAANVFGYAATGVTSVLLGLRYFILLGFGSEPTVRLYRSQGTEGTPTATADGAVLGDVRGYGHNGTAFALSSLLRFFQDGAVTGSNVPGGVSLYGRTTAGASVEAIKVRATGAVEIKKGATLGGAATDVLTCTGRLVLRQIANTTSKPGSLGELVFCTGDSKTYSCTSASETAATWVALN